jgi:hypothetical protein
MSAEKQRDPAEDTTGRPAQTEEKATKPDEDPKQGMNYVFKISPADPKSSFDFEDVADK